MKTGELGAHCARAKTRVWLPGKRCLFDLSKVGATLAAAGFLLAGCSGGPPTLAGPKRINPAIEEVAGVQELFADMKKVWPALDIAISKAPKPSSRLWRTTTFP